MRTIQISFLALAALHAFACSDSSPADDDDGDPATPADGGDSDPEACATLATCCAGLDGSEATSCNAVVSSGAGAACTQAYTNFACDDEEPLPADCEVPTDNFGASVGRPLRPFTLPDCDGEDYSFYNEDFCEAKFTVISIAAEWCGPCQVESGLLEEHINDVYADQGIRVLQVIVQDLSFGPPTEELCDRWVETYGLSNVELIDPAGATQIYFPDGSLPSTIIVDSEGTIVFRENGVSDELITLKAKLDELLEELEESEE